jgi:hypothetical protein
MKRIFKLDRLRLRGLSGAKDEVLLTHRTEPAAPRQVPLPPAAIGCSPLRRVVGLDARSRELHKLTNAHPSQKTSRVLQDNRRQSGH